MEYVDKPVERLLSMFATNRRATRTGAVRRRNNGATRFCELSGLHPSEVSRWRHGCPERKIVAGEVPPIHNDKVLFACDQAGIPRDALVGILRVPTCPTCGQEIAGSDILAAGNAR